MSRFKQYLNEGGTALKNSSRIDSENFSTTLDDLYKSLFKSSILSKKDISVIGSGGKKSPKDTYGDVDIAVSIKQILKNNKKLVTYEDCFNYIVKIANKLSNDVVINKGTKVISFLWPITNKNGRQKGEFAQIDLMIVESGLDWAQFFYHSPFYYESNWKAVYRVYLLAAVAREAEYKILDKEEEYTTEWSKLTVSQKRGLIRQVRTNISKKTGKRVKSERIKKEEFITEDPIETVAILFGSDFSPQDVSSYEKIMKVIESPKFIHKDKKEQIKKNAAKSIRNNNLPLPKELENYI